MQVVADILSNVLDESNAPAFTATEMVSALYLYHHSVCTLALILIDILWCSSYNVYTYFNNHNIIIGKREKDSCSFVPCIHH